METINCKLTEASKNIAPAWAGKHRAGSIPKTINMCTSTFSHNASWYVVQTKPRQEWRALEQLQNQSYTCYLPTMQVEKIRSGKLKVCSEPLFARYLFIQLDPALNKWSPIRSTRGVAKLVSFGSRFATLPDLCIEALRGAEGSVKLHKFESGDRVTITAGPFSGLEGIYEMCSSDARGLVLIDFLGQPQKLEFAVEMLSKAA